MVLLKGIYMKLLKNKKWIFPFFSFIFLPFFLILPITLLLSLLQLCLLILPLQVFLRNPMEEKFKQRIKVAWSTPIHDVKWWISHFRTVHRTQGASEVELFVILVSSFWPLHVTGNSAFVAVRVLDLPLHYYFYYYYYYYYYYY